MGFGHGALEIGDSRRVQPQDTAVHSKESDHVFMFFII